MNNKTVVFDVQREIAELKRRVAYLEKLDPSYGKTFAYSEFKNPWPDIPKDMTGIPIKFSLDAVGRDDCKIDFASIISNVSEEEIKRIGEGLHKAPDKSVKELYESFVNKEKKLGE